MTSLLNSSSKFQGKVAIVTGATSGIGKTIAVALAEAGASVVLVGRRESEGRAIVEQIEKNGGRASYFKADTSKETDIEAMVAFTVEKYGRLDLAVNNAGVVSGNATTEVTVEEYRRVFDLNVWGVLASMKHEIRAMLKNGGAAATAGGGGSIVNVSSIVGSKGLPQLQVYTASKHAVEGLTKAVALEYAKSGIRVNAVAPGPFATEMLDQAAPTDEAKNAFAATVPLGRLGKTEELIPPVLYLLDPANSFVTGTVVAVDGGILA